MLGYRYIVHAGGLLSALWLWASPAAQAATERVSLGPGGVQGNGVSSHATVVGDGRFVGFSSTATNLVPGDGNGVEDVFVRGRQSGTTSRISVSTSGVAGNAGSLKPALTQDGRLVAFQSFASNLVAGDTNRKLDIFLHDRQVGSTRRISAATGGGSANGASTFAAWSPDDRYLLFSSLASNLVPGDTNNAADIFIYDRIAARIERASVTQDGGQANGPSEFFAYMTADSRFVVFRSSASNLVSNDTNGLADIFVRDRQTGAVERASVSQSGAQGNRESIFPTISADGRYVVFHSAATNLVPGDSNGKLDVFIRDRQAGTTARVSVSSSGSQGNGGSEDGKITPDGRYVAFESLASNFVGGDTNGQIDVFVRDL
jgi:Tol biopolymer transport system component